MQYNAVLYVCIYLCTPTLVGVLLAFKGGREVKLFTFALLAILLGMKHGVDGDHVAAIADMVGSEEKNGNKFRSE